MRLDGPPEVKPPASTENVLWDVLALWREGRPLAKKQASKPLTFEEKIDKAIEGTPLAVRERIESLIQGLRSRDKDGRAKSEADLKDYGKAAVPFLLRALGDDDFRKREAAHKFLASMKGDAVEGLLSALKSTDPEIRNRADTLLGEFGKKIGAIKDDRGRLRRLYDPKSGDLLVSTDYRDDGVLVEAKTRNVSFRLQADGKYIRSDLPGTKLDKVAVDGTGNVRFTVGPRNEVEWAPDRTIRFYTDGRFSGGIRPDGTPIPARGFEPPL
jgi:hypothetical protein